MSEKKTPAQAAYEAAAKWDTELDEPPMLLKPWGQLNEKDRDCWQRVADAVVAVAVPKTVTVDMHRWYAILRLGGVDGRVMAVLAATSDGIASYDSVAEWEAANT